jgi:hypothetical protein
MVPPFFFLQSTTRYQCWRIECTLKGNPQSFAAFPMTDGFPLFL